MWIKIFIHIPGRIIAHFDRIMERLEWQLSLTGTLPLDIAWSAHGRIDKSNIIRMYQLIRNYAPINRWRSLQYLGSEPYPGISEASLAPEGEGFDALESLYIQGWPMESTLAELIDRTALKLHELDLVSFASEQTGSDDDLEIDTSLVPLRVQSRITFLQYNHTSAADNLRGFKNVIHFTGSASSLLGSFQHLTFLTLTYGNIEDLYHIRRFLVNLVSLDACLSPLRASPPEIIPLPSLLDLVITWEGHYSEVPLTWIWAPMLDRLVLRSRNESSHLSMARSMQRHFTPSSRSQYRLEPPRLLLEIPLEPEVISKILRYSPAVRHLTITLKREIHVPDKVIGNMFTEVKRSNTAINDMSWEYCPSLVFLQISLQWKCDDKDIWVHCATKIVEARSSDGLRVQVTWANSDAIEVSP